MSQKIFYDNSPEAKSVCAAYVLEHSPDFYIRTAYRIIDDEVFGPIVVLKGFATVVYHPTPDEPDWSGSNTAEFDLQ